MAEYLCLFDGAEVQPGPEMSDWVKDTSRIMMWKNGFVENPLYDFAAT